MTVYQFKPGKITPMKLQHFEQMRAGNLQAAYDERREAGNPSNFIIIDPGEEIVCDFCNADIITKDNPETVFMLGESHALCKSCAEDVKQKGESA